MKAQMILKSFERPSYLIVCERLEDKSRFFEATLTPDEALRLLLRTSPKYYRPLYLIRIKWK